MVLPPLKCISIPHFLQMFLQLSSHAFRIGHHNVGLLVAEACVIPGVTGILVGSVVFHMFDIGPVQSPCWILASF